jgi:hypothetical protein
MATLYSTDGTVREITPHGATWAREELQGIVGGYYEIVRTTDGRFMVINETAKVQRNPLPPNVNATLIYKHGHVDYIAGPAVVIGNRQEIDEDDDLRVIPHAEVLDDLENGRIPPKTTWS